MKWDDKLLATMWFRFIWKVYLTSLCSLLIPEIAIDLDFWIKRALLGWFGFCGINIVRKRAVSRLTWCFKFQRRVKFHMALKFIVIINFLILESSITVIMRPTFQGNFFFWAWQMGHWDFVCRAEFRWPSLKIWKVCFLSDNRFLIWFLMAKADQLRR